VVESLKVAGFTKPEEALKQQVIPNVEVKAANQNNEEKKESLEVKEENKMVDDEQQKGPNAEEDIAPEKTESESKMVPKDMKVVELRAELKKRGIDYSGVKAKLVGRLEKALKNE